MVLDDGRADEELGLREVLEQMLEWQAELMVVLKQILSELNRPGADRSLGTVRINKPPLDRGRPQLRPGGRHLLRRRRGRGVG
jgi:hypothetical protein